MSIVIGINTSALFLASAFHTSCLWNFILSRSFTKKIPLVSLVTGTEKCNKLLLT